MNPVMPTPVEVAERLWQFYAGPPPGAGTSEDLSVLAERFIELKQHLGHRYHRDGGHVRDFLQFQRSRGVRRARQLSLSALVAWAHSRSHVHPLTWWRELCAVSVFLDHLKSIGRIPNNPCLLLRQRPRSNFRPYIFSLHELERLFAPIDEKGPRRDRLLVYRVIYGCALRVSEATKLEVRDFDESRGTLFIRKTKFNKERLLPLNASLLERLCRHVAELPSETSPEEPLFVDQQGRRWCHNQLSSYFRQELVRLGIYHPTREVDGVRYGSPRTHSLRHSFAVHRLLAWYRQGADVQSKLPLLSTYLGHSDVIYTQVYLKATSLLLREANKRFASRWEKEFPLKP